VSLHPQIRRRKDQTGSPGTKEKVLSLRIKVHLLSPRIGRTSPGPPPEVEGLVTTKINKISRTVFNIKNTIRIYFI
jgi:hypothetical protein